jgi:hypothetical protein
MAAHGYEPPVEASEGASAMRSRSGHYERSVREWAMREGWGGRPVRQEQAQGILVAALGMLAAHVGYREARRAS